VIQSRTNNLAGAVTNSCLKVTGWATGSSTSHLQVTGNEAACPGDGTNIHAFSSTTIVSGGWWFATPFSTAYLLNDGATPAECLIVGYDRDLDNIADTNEYFGFRRDTTENAIETWQSGTLGCSSGTWTNISDEGTIAIDAFNFRRITPATSSLIQYRVTITGHLISAPSVSRTIEDVVRMRNDPLS
jgi:hypothetical protein